MVLVTGSTVKEVAPNAGVKTILISTPATFVGGTDTIEVDLTSYGARKVHAIFASSATTTGSVLVAATAAVSGVSAGVATITTSAAGTNVYNIVLFAELLQTSQVAIVRRDRSDVH